MKNLNSSDKIEYGIIKSHDLKNKLWSLRWKAFLAPILFLIIYLLLKFTEILDVKLIGHKLIAYLFLAIIVILINQFKSGLVYKFSFEEEKINFFLINILGQKKTLSIPFNQIEKIKYRNKSGIKTYTSIWFHKSDEVFELSFLDNELSEFLYNKMDVVKL